MNNNIIDSEEKHQKKDKDLKEDKTKVDFKAQLKQQNIQQQKQIRIGPFIFSKGISQSLRSRLEHLYRNAININRAIETLRLQNGRFQELIPEQALQIAESYRIDTLTELNLSNNKLSTTLFLKKCHFQNLLVLNLTRNRLTNIASLFNELHFPQLQELLLSNNQFISLRGMKKWRLPRLAKLALQLNFICEIGEIYLAQLPSLIELVLYANNIIDGRSIFKCDFPRLSELDICTFKVSRRKRLLTRFMPDLFCVKCQIQLPFSWHPQEMNDFDRFGQQQCTSIKSWLLGLHYSSKMLAYSQINSLIASIKALFFLLGQIIDLTDAEFRTLLLDDVKVRVEGMYQMLSHKLSLYFSVDMHLQLICLTVFLHSYYSLQL